tara:strand:+ start:16 stop:921 length:906 start_codon:yes stop_codon:yes gene_type:complete
MKNYDLFGNPIIEKTNLKTEFIISPFSIFDTTNGDWQQRKDRWKSLGIKSEVGRENKNRHIRYTEDGSFIGLKSEDKDNTKTSYLSIFDPVLCEVIYTWFVPANGSILDPFAGGSVRGVVANYLDYKYTGIELREEQVDANIQQGIDIVPHNTPVWICGNSNKALEMFDRKFDFIFSCPPYYGLEKYCDDPNDLSNMNYNEFNRAYKSIIKKSCILLKNNRYACFVVGNCRDKDGFMMNLIGETIQSFERAGLKFYNEIILRNMIGSAGLRAKNNMIYKKVVKVHQNVLVFVKGNPKEIEI